MKFEGRNAIVTGASKGIGRGIAIELARQGANVCLNYFSSDAGAKEAAAEIESLGRKALLVQGDVSDQSFVEGMVEKAVAEFGSLEMFVSNAVYSDRERMIEANQTQIEVDEPEEDSMSLLMGAEADKPVEDDMSEETAEWVRAQNVTTQSYLKHIPYREAIEKRLSDLLDYENVTWGEDGGEPFRLNRIEPADASDDDKAALTKMVNNLVNASSIRILLEE